MIAWFQNLDMDDKAFYLFSILGLALTIAFCLIVYRLYKIAHESNVK